MFVDYSLLLFASASSLYAGRCFLVVVCWLFVVSCRLLVVGFLFIVCLLFVCVFSFFCVMLVLWLKQRLVCTCLFVLYGCVFACWFPCAVCLLSSVFSSLPSLVLPLLLRFVVVLCWW